MTILGLAESPKTINRPDLIRPDPTVTQFDSLFIEKYKRQRRKILTQSLFLSLICAIKICNRYL